MQFCVEKKCLLKKKNYAFYLAHIALNTHFLLFCKQQQEQDPTNLYISNLPLSVDEKELEKMLQPFGQVVSTRILRDYSGNSRGVGFARCVTKRKILHLAPSKTPLQ